MRKVVGLLLASFTCLLQAAPTDIQLIGPTVSDWIHVGDSTVTSWPASVGDYWSVRLALDASPFGDSTLRLYHIEADSGTDPVFVNGIEVGWLAESDGTINRDPNNPDEWVEQSITVPSGLLHVGENTIRVEAGISFPGTSFPLDDFMMKDMRLTLVPEPSTFPLLGLGFLVFLTWRKRIAGCRRHLKQETGMKHTLLVCCAALFVAMPWGRCSGIQSQGAVTVYSNTFDSDADLDDFVIFGETFNGYYPPPLHTVSVTNQELRIDTTEYYPNGPGTHPVLNGRATLAVNSSGFAAPYVSTLADSPGMVIWGVNVANMPGDFANVFEVTLVSTGIDPYAISSRGYTLSGEYGIGSQNTVTLSRFDYGLGGGGQTLIASWEAFGTLPERGSLRVTYDPSSDRWSVYGEAGLSFTDPLNVTTLLGSTIEGTYTSMATPYMSVSGINTGVDIFDNLTVQVVPEPTTFTLLSLGSLALVMRRRRR